MNKVQLDKLSLVDFRNIEQLSFKPGSRFNVISGKNGMGKTNFIEAVYLLGSLRSFRTSVRRELVRHEQAAARVVGVFGQASAGKTCEITIDKEGRRVRVDGKLAGVEGDHFRSLPMVLFHPGNMELVQGGPEARRRFMDRALFQAELSYPELHRSYNRALSSRNKLLKDRSPDMRSINPFDAQLAQLGAKIMENRADLITKMRPLFEETVTEVSGGNIANLVYKPKVEGGSEELAAALAAAFPKDFERGFTSVGPHADDIIFKIDKQRARKFASQGQQRTLVLALKIAETKALAKSTGKMPLLLLDDISSELDRDRNSKMFEFLNTVAGQVFITTTHLDHIPLTDQRCDFKVENGRIT